MDEPRVVVWFSCGAASATAAYLILKKYPAERVHLVYCDVMSTEHSDNARFLADVERWLGKKVEIIKSDRFASIDDVFERTKYMAGIHGARCTIEMKKAPRFAYQRWDDIHVFGMVAEETKRIENLEHNSPDLRFDWILRDQNVSKADCLQTILQAGISLPVMYGLGFRNNNCIGCVKATSIEYWKKVRKHFPEVFERRAKQSRELGVRLTRLHGVRIFLDEIPLDDFDGVIEENISCGPDCQFELPLSRKQEFTERDERAM